LNVAGGLRSREGYLVLADISGYTGFLTETELEHAQEIIHELTSLIRTRLSPPMRFVKLEGDAIFCYAETGTFTDGERLVELIEVCYFEFADRLFNMARATTCRCNACASIDSLDLKFVAHHGAFVVQRDEAGEDLVGADVILAHRLLKNNIIEQTGMRAYAFFTDACLQHLPSAFVFPKHTEKYETFGETSGGVHDLASVLREMREARHEYVGSDDADYEANIAVPRPPEIVWQYLVDPVQRLRWACVLFNKNPDEIQANARGRVGVGAKVHCNHGPAEAYREIIDWRPFSYFTTRGTTRWRVPVIPGRPILETYELTPDGDAATVLSWRLRYIDRGRVSMLSLRLLKLLFRGGIRHGEARLRAAIESDLGAQA
jgi:hypothetical protein